MKRILVSLVLSLALTGTALADGLYWESKTTSGPMGSRVSKSYAIPDKFKTVDEFVTVIMRLDKNVILQVHDKEKKYTEMTFAELEQAGKQAEAMMDQIAAMQESQMSSMPPAQREKMKKMMGDRMPAAAAKKDANIEIKNTGEKKTISGFACTKYVVNQSGGPQSVVWATKDIDGFDAIRKGWEDFRKRMMVLMPGGNKNIGAAFAQIDGFPIQTEMAHGMTTTVTKVEKRAIADSEFEIPAGYVKEKIPMPAQMGGGMGEAGKAVMPK